MEWHRMIQEVEDSHELADPFLVRMARVYCSLSKNSTLGLSLLLIREIVAP